MQYKLTQVKNFSLFLPLFCNILMLAGFSGLQIKNFIVYFS
jgi:hypothetical protein